MTSILRLNGKNARQIGTIRRMVKRLLPKVIRDGLRYVTNRGYRKMLHAARRQSRVAMLVAQSSPQLWTATAGTVASGPFKGLRYISQSVGSQWAPKLLGTYEIELAPIIESIVSQAPACIVDVGAAEGYYTVGLAWRIPGARVVAFEVEESGRKLLHKFAASNGVGKRIEMCGLCSPSSLNESLRDGFGTVVICDVEGAELQILDPGKALGLSRANVLVEVHPWGHEHMADVLRQRFERTHAIHEIHTRPRTPMDWPLAMQLSRTSAIACMDEMRPCPMTWLWMVAR